MKGVKPVEISPEHKLFNLSEAQALLPLLNKITARYVVELEPLQNRLDRMLSNDPRRAEVEREYELKICEWRGKVTRLGAKAAALWVIEFEVGGGALNWRYPELQIAFFRPNGDTIRAKLNDYIDENDPDWAL